MHLVTQFHLTKIECRRHYRHADPNGAKKGERHHSINILSLRDWEMKDIVWKGAGAVGKPHRPQSRKGEVRKPR